MASAGKTTGLINSVLSSGVNLGDAMNVYFGIQDYKDAKRQGNGTALSLAKAAGSFAWGEFYYGALGSAFGMPATIAMSLAPAVAKVAGTAVVNNMGANNRVLNQPFSGKGKVGSGYFNITEYGYTMRQRSLNAIRQNRTNTESVLGNEARQYASGRYV